MVKGLDKFKSYFEKFYDCYVIFGGVACSVLLSRYNLEFRATKDIDVCLNISATGDDFLNKLKNFIVEGRYQHKLSDGKKIFYRFFKPEAKGFPDCIELFCRHKIDIGSDQLVAPVYEDDRSLRFSAILMDDEYYNLTIKGRIIEDGLPVLSPEYLILLKAKAYLSLIDTENADDRDIKKHRNDIFRLVGILDPSKKTEVDYKVFADFRKFLSQIDRKSVQPVLKQLRIDISVDEMIDLLESLYVSV